MSPTPTGEVRRTGEGRDLVLIRDLPGSIDDAWASLTESERTGRWFASWTGDGRVGGAITLTLVAEEGSPTAPKPRSRPVNRRPGWPSAPRTSPAAGSSRRAWNLSVRTGPGSPSCTISTPPTRPSRPGPAGSTTWTGSSPPAPAGRCPTSATTGRPWVRTTRARIRDREPGAGLGEGRRQQQGQQGELDGGSQHVTGDAAEPADGEPDDPVRDHGADQHRGQARSTRATPASSAVTVTTARRQRPDRRPAPGVPPSRPPSRRDRPAAPPAPRCGSRPAGAAREAAIRTTSSDGPVDRRRRAPTPRPPDRRARAAGRSPPSGPRRRAA